MACEPLKPALVVHEERPSRTRALVQTFRDRKSTDTHSSDPEAVEMVEPHKNDGDLDLNHYRIIDEVWHFCSVDWGSKCKTLHID